LFGHGGGEKDVGYRKFALEFIQFRIGGGSSSDNGAFKRGLEKGGGKGSIKIYIYIYIYIYTSFSPYLFSFSLSQAAKRDSILFVWSPRRCH
jgi:hypothetical protein